MQDPWKEPFERESSPQPNVVICPGFGPATLTKREVEALRRHFGPTLFMPTEPRDEDEHLHDCERLPTKAVLVRTVGPMFYKAISHGFTHVMFGGLVLNRVKDDGSLVPL